LLKSLSIKQGVKYDDPASAAEIPAFIEFHNLPVDEVLDPLDSFKTFNEFFYRCVPVPIPCSISHFYTILANSSRALVRSKRPKTPTAS